MSRRFDERTINLALSILHDQLGKLNAQDIGTPDVRLALRVLYRHIPHCTALADFWGHGTTKEKHPWNSGHHEYRVILQALRGAGWAIDRPYQDWPSPRD